MRQLCDLLLEREDSIAEPVVKSRPKRRRHEPAKSIHKRRGQEKQRVAMEPDETEMFPHLARALDVYNRDPHRRDPFDETRLREGMLFLRSL